LITAGKTERKKCASLSNPAKADFIGEGKSVGKKGGNSTYNRPVKEAKQCRSGFFSGKKEV